MPDRFPSVFAILLILVSIPALAKGQDEKATADKDWVSARVQRLDADTLRERALAERELLNAGPEVLPLLPPPELLPSAAVRQAVRRIRLRLEEAKARESVKASHVTITGKFTVREILKKITEQTGNELDTNGLNAEILDRSITSDLDKLDFWKALISIGEKAGFQIEGQSEDPAASGVRLVPVDSKTPTAERTTKAAFLIEAERAQRRPRFGDDDSQLLRVPMRISAEPRLRPLFLKLEGQDFSVKTMSGMELSPFNPDAKLELPLGEGGNTADFHMDFLVPKPFREPVLSLRGKAILTVAAGTEDIAFTNLTKAEGSARRRGGVTVTLNEIAFQADEKNADRQTATIRVTVHYDTGGPAFESHRTWIFHNLAYLEDAKGKRIERNSDFHTALQTDGGVIVEYNFDDLPKDVSDLEFIYVAPTLIINVPVEFKFEKLPGERGA